MIDIFKIFMLILYYFYGGENLSYYFYFKKILKYILFKFNYLNICINDILYKDFLPSLSTPQNEYLY